MTHNICTFHLFPSSFINMRYEAAVIELSSRCCAISQRKFLTWYYDKSMLLMAGIPFIYLEFNDRCSSVKISGPGLIFKILAASRTWHWLFSWSVHVHCAGHKFWRKGRPKDWVVQPSTSKIGWKLGNMFSSWMFANWPGGPYVIIWITGSLYNELIPWLPKFFKNWLVFVRLSTLFSILLPSL